MPDDISPQTADAIINKLMQRLSDKGVYSDAMNSVAPQHRQELEASMERHAAHQRAAGKNGW